jgi:hypothetical protein
MTTLNEKEFLVTRILIEYPDLVTRLTVRLDAPYTLGDRAIPELNMAGLVAMRLISLVDQFGAQEVAGRVEGRRPGGGGKSPRRRYAGEGEYCDEQGTQQDGKHKLVSHKTFLLVNSAISNKFNIQFWHEKTPPSLSISPCQCLLLPVASLFLPAKQKGEKNVIPL